MNNKTKVRKRVGSIYITLGVFFCFCAVVLLAYPQLPYILNSLSLNTPEIEAENIALPVYEEEIEEVVPVITEQKIVLPTSKAELPEANKIYIPSIGVNADIQTGEDPNLALDKGPWIVPDYANPENRYLQQTDRSIIIASHRFGYSSWSEQMRNSISFFKLPDTKIGDSIVLIWNQREYIYEIVDTDQDTHIKGRDSDLILYTCMYYNSPSRIFRYADLVSINGESIQ